MKNKILIVDDTEENIDVLAKLLENSYDLSIAIDGFSAMEAVKAETPDLILLDIMMPGMDGYEVCKRLKKNAITKDIPVIFLTALDYDFNETKGLELGAVDFITKPFNNDIVNIRIRNHLLFRTQQVNLEKLVRERTQELELTQEVLIHSIGNLAEYRDPETGQHIKRSGHYVKVLAEYLCLDVKFKDYLNNNIVELMFKSAPLHDIGKVGVPDNILLKDGKLTDDEFVEMMKHAIYGKEVIESAQKELGGESFLKYAKEIAYYHHEKWDGSGYPQGLKGDAIPLSGRIMALADVYDALISKRVYKPQYSHEKAKRIILEGRGKHFDPQIVDAFIAIESQFKKIALSYLDSDVNKQILLNE